ncbi:MAG TPA: hypothetical protein V6D03_03435 [Candidatus Caenarcaniphilales bacterium]
MTPKSGFFLASSCVAFIAAVGSIFELASGQPNFGNLATTVIMIASFPLGAYCFLAAVRDVNANR